MIRFLLHSESDLEVEFSYTQGITVTSSVGMTFSASMSEEVKGGCIAASASGSISAGWEAEISSSSTWAESTTVMMMMMIMMMMMMVMMVMMMMMMMMMMMVVGDDGDDDDEW